MEPTAIRPVPSGPGRDRPRPASRLSTAGGALALVVAAALSLVVVARDAVNALTLWTVLVGAAAGVLAMRSRGGRGGLVAAAMVMLAALPALFGGLGFLYVPAALLMVASAVSLRGR